jgi:TatD DNase family protein
MLIDTHAHLQMSDYDSDRDEVIDRAAEVGVEYIINASFDLSSSQQAVKLTEEHENLYAAVGVHPHDAKLLDDDTLDALRDLAGHPKVVAIGETGLDYYRNLSPRPVQRSAFEKQLRLAEEVDLPVIIHNRDAHEDVLEILRRHSGGVASFSLRGVMHCFSGDLDFADNCIQMGLYISFAGPVTYPKSQQLREVAAHVPWDKFFVETDCPYLAPQFRRGKRNEPSYVKAVAKKVAEIRRTTFPETARITTANAKALFGIADQ